MKFETFKNFDGDSHEATAEAYSSILCTNFSNQHRNSSVAIWKCKLAISRTEDREHGSAVLINKLNFSALNSQLIESQEAESRGCFLNYSCKLTASPCNEKLQSHE